MKSVKNVQEIKFSKFQALSSLLFPLVLFEPVSKMIRQGLDFREYYWFIIIFIVAGYVFWHFIRITALMMAGVPAIIIERKTITLTEKGYALEWKDIEEMNMVVTGGKGRSYNLVITVKEPWKYISGIRNPLMRYYCWYAKDYFYNPFSINLSMIAGDNYEVYNTIESYYRQYK
jgi:hypothetical protein